VDLLAGAAGTVPVDELAGLDLQPGLFLDLADGGVG
jgi:hypothetical protein